MTRRTENSLVAIAAIVGAILVISIVWAIRPAYAHSWFTGKTDPVIGGQCCDGRDCIEIVDTDVMAVAGGYIYLPLDNGAGPVKDNPGFIAEARVQSSASFGYAICLGGGQYSTGSTSMTSPAFVRCFFAPSGF